MEKMTAQEQYAPGPASGARVQKDGDRWALVLVRDLRHPPEKVWQALTDPKHLREWAPFEADANLGAAGTEAKLTWVGTARVTETKVIRADPPRTLEFSDIRWELEPLANGTRLTLWHSIDRGYIAWGAAGWHISLEVLDRLLMGAPVGRIAGADAMRFGRWKELVAEYAEQFGVGSPGAPSNVPKPNVGEH
jgi:hypothetical protein